MSTFTNATLKKFAKGKVTRDRFRDSWNFRPCKRKAAITFQLPFRTRTRLPWATIWNRRAKNKDPAPKWIPWSCQAVLPPISRPIITISLLYVEILKLKLTSYRWWSQRVVFSAQKVNRCSHLAQVILRRLWKTISAHITIIAIVKVNEPLTCRKSCYYCNCFNF